MNRVSPECCARIGGLFSATSLKGSHHLKGCRIIYSFLLLTLALINSILKSTWQSLHAFLTGIVMDQHCVAQNTIGWWETAQSSMGMGLAVPAPYTTLKENMQIIWGFKSAIGQEMFYSDIPSAIILKKSLRHVTTQIKSSKMMLITSHVLLYLLACQWENFLTKKSLFSKGIKPKTLFILWHKE